MLHWKDQSDSANDTALSLGHKWPSSPASFLVKEAQQVLRVRSTGKSDGVPVRELVEHRRADFSRVKVQLGLHGCFSDREPLDTLDGTDAGAVDGVILCLNVSTKQAKL